MLNTYQLVENKYIQKLFAYDECELSGRLFIAMVLEHIENAGKELMRFDGHTSLKITL